jgi:thiamine-phosphate pyrophosphorylase
MEALAQRVEEAFDAGIEFVQLREKDLPARQLSEIVSTLVRRPGKKKTRLIVNERLDVARACGADGVHLPSDGPPMSLVRGVVEKDWIAGISCHNREELEAAARGGADYALLGPVFETPSKPGARVLGVAAFGDLCRAASVPVFALGGVDLANARQCIRAGAQGIAGIRLFQEARSIREICESLRAL